MKYEIHKINGKHTKCPVYQNGDTVTFNGIKGIVDKTECGGLYVYINWEKKTTDMTDCMIVTQLM